MDYLGIIYIILVLFFSIKGKVLGLILSIFDLVQLVISFKVSKKYYSIVYKFIYHNSKIYWIFNKIVYFILELLFLGSTKYNLDLSSKLIKSDIIKLVILFFSIALIYSISNKILSMVFSMFSFLFKIRVLRKTDKILGFILGFIKALIIIYMIESTLLMLFNNGILRELPKIYLYPMANLK